MWMKIDDGLHAHRKTRAVTKSHPDKRRDAAPMGLWVLAGSWAALHRTDGWVPADELDRWDEDYEALVVRLVDAGYWWPADRDGEPGYGFTDWHDYNDPADMASKSGTFGNHVRWHVNEAKVDPACDHCPKEPDEPEDHGAIAPDIGGRSGGESHPDSGGESRLASPPIALPVPEPDPIPNPSPELLSRDKSLETDPLDRFDEFWDTYAKKVDRKKAEAKWRLALKRVGVTPDLLIESARAYVTWERENNEGGRFIMDPARWLNGCRWEDERPARQAAQSRSQQWLQLAADLGPQGPQQPSNVRAIGGGDR